MSLAAGICEVVLTVGLAVLLAAYTQKPLWVFGGFLLYAGIFFVKAIRQRGGHDGQSKKES